MSRPSKPKAARAVVANPGVTDVPLPATTADAPPPDHPYPADPQGPEATGAVREPASAAAGTAAAPVAPTPASAGPGPMHEPATTLPPLDDHADRYGPEGYAVVVNGPAKGRWRAGRKFGPEPVSIPAEELTEPELRALEEDPELTMKIVKIEV